MNSAIFNRAAGLTDGDWIHIVPRGELPNAEAGIIQVLDDVALNSIITNLEKDKARLGNRWPGFTGVRSTSSTIQRSLRRRSHGLRGFKTATMVSGRARMD